MGLPKVEQSLLIKLIVKRRPFELLGVASLTLTCFAFSVWMVPGSSGVYGGLLGGVTIAIAVIDAKFFRIPDGLTIAILLLGLLHSATGAPPDEINYALGVAVLRGIGLALPFFFLWAFYRLARGRDGLGLGDIKLAAAGGAWLNWISMPMAIEIATLSALSLYTARRLLNGQPVKMTARLPFGLFFAPAIWITWLFQSAQQSIVIGS